ncbi:MAG: HAD domain-containing protein [Solirubrobacterales bacterium]
MSRPILAVDVDGVISLFGFEEPPDRANARFELIDGMVHCISLVAGERLRRLAEHYDLVWATGWEERANDYLPTMLGLPELPHLSFDGAARFGSAHWKLGPLQEYGTGRAMAWVDDNFDESCYAWAQTRAEPTLLVQTEPHLGLEEAQTEALSAWAQGLVRERRERA